MQTILGAGGSIGIELARILPSYTSKIRLVGRNPRKINPNDELVTADLLNKAEVMKAVKGSEVVYLLVGLPYKAKTWQEMWPSVMQNTIAACKQHKAKLVFFDNIYLYAPHNLNPILETTPIDPSSNKGKVRAALVEMLQQEMDSGTLKGLIARAPDFYGPGIRNGVLNDAVLKPLKEGKKANWFCSVDKLHSFIWTPDAAKATAILGNDETAYNQTWHLPTTTETLTGKQLIEMIAAELKVKCKYQVAGPILVKLLGLFNPLMKEFIEMLYQYDRDYVFDSSKFSRKYDFPVTSYQEGIKIMCNKQV